ncbi:MAG: hypothetical protein QNK89_01885 [Lacinutrix sp.]|uniref:hypothetical protein n=1 Tax=Lacinutrix sp. TaxID=1937692 RepID=UPI0030B1B413
MKTHITLLTFLIISMACFAQNEHKYVKLVEEKKGKCLTLYAVNSDSISYDVF